MLSAKNFFLIFFFFFQVLISVRRSKDSSKLIDKIGSI